MVQYVASGFSRTTLRRAGGAPCRRRRDSRHRSRLRGLGARHGAAAGGEAALERFLDAAFDRLGRFAHDFGDLRDDQKFGAIQYPLLPERQALGPAQQRQALQDVCDVVDGAGAHLVRVVLEAAFPVLMAVDLAVSERVEEPLDLRVADRAPKAYAIDVIERDEYRRLVRDNTEVIKTTGGTENRLFFDPRYDAEPLV